MQPLSWEEYQAMLAQKGYPPGTQEDYNRYVGFVRAGLINPDGSPGPNQSAGTGPGGRSGPIPGTGPGTQPGDPDIIPERDQDTSIYRSGPGGAGQYLTGDGSGGGLDIDLGGAWDFVKANWDKLFKLGLIGVGVYNAVKAGESAGKAGEAADEAIRLAREDYEGRAPLRTKALGLLDNNMAGFGITSLGGGRPPSLAAAFSDPGNPYNRFGPGSTMPAVPQASIPTTTDPVYPPSPPLPGSSPALPPDPQGNFLPSPRRDPYRQGAMKAVI